MSTNEIEQAVQLVTMQLSGNAALVAVVADQIHGTHPVMADAGSFGCPCVIVDVLRRRGNYSRRKQMMTFEVYAYSKLSKSQALQVYDLVYGALHAQRLVDASGTIAQAGYAYEDESAVSGWNADVQAWFARGIWRVNVAG